MGAAEGRCTKGADIGRLRPHPSGMQRFSHDINNNDNNGSDVM